MVFKTYNALNTNLFLKSHIYQGQLISRSRFFKVKVFQHPEFTETREFRVQIQGTSQYSD